MEHLLFVVDIIAALLGLTIVLAFFLLARRGNWVKNSHAREALLVVLGLGGCIIVIVGLKGDASQALYRLKHGSIPSRALVQTGYEEEPGSTPAEPEELEGTSAPMLIASMAQLQLFCASDGTSDEFADLVAEKILARLSRPREDTATEPEPVPASAPTRPDLFDPSRIEMDNSTEPLVCTDFTLLHPSDKGPGPEDCYAVGCQEGYVAPMQLDGGVWAPCHSYARIPKRGSCFLITNKDGSKRSVAFVGNKWIDKNCQ